VVLVVLEEAAAAEVTFWDLLMGVVLGALVQAVAVAKVIMEGHRARELGSLAVGSLTY